MPFMLRTALTLTSAQQMLCLYHMFAVSHLHCFHMYTGVSHPPSKFGLATFAAVIDNCSGFSYGGLDQRSLGPVNLFKGC